jgi:ABC-2 type transport system permease protein
MILSIALKEWKEFWRHRGMRLIVLAFIAIYAVSVFGGVVRHGRYERERIAAQQAVRQAWLNQGEKSPHAATYFGTVVFPRRSALSILEPGALPYLGVAAYLRAHRPTEFVDLPARDESPLAGMVNITPADCWRILFPFLIVLLTYSALARDRETGMERYLMAVGSNRATLVFGKTFGVSMVIVAVFLVTFGLGGLAASLTAGFGEDDTTAWLLLGLFYLLFSGTVFFLALAISGLASTSRRALSGGLVMWLMLTIILPRLAADYGRVSTSSPSSVEMRRITELDIEKGFEDRPQRETRMETTLNLLFSELKVGRREELPVNFPGFIFISEGEVQKASERRRRAMARATFEAQTSAMEQASVISPATAIQLISSTLAGTSAVQQEKALDDADEYGHRFRRILNRELAAKGKQAGAAMLNGRSLWNMVDSFEADLPEQIDAASGRSRSIVNLLIWFTAAMLAAATSGLVLPQMGERA